jgi:hypothetical protein
MKNLIKLSASRIKTLQSCSWLYHCNYNLKLPQKNNSGAMRGTIAHLVLELVAKKRHAKYIKKILADNNCSNSPAVLKLIQRAAKKEGLDLNSLAEPITKNDIPISNIQCIEEMVITALKFDFVKKRKTVGTELEFDIVSENPRYRIGGFIDRIFEEDGAAIIRDFKSSKKPFSNSELADNVQAMMYSLAIKKTYKKYKDILVRFLFLRHPANPERECPAFSEEELNGFEYYLQYLNDYLRSFTEKEASSNFASKSFKTKWMCKTKSGWKCPYLEPIKYKVLLDEKGSIVKSIFADKEFSPSDIKNDYKIEERLYNGCPSWQTLPENNFDF